MLCPASGQRFPAGRCVQWRAFRCQLGRASFNNRKWEASPPHPLTGNQNWVPGWEEGRKLGRGEGLCQGLSGASPALPRGRAQEGMGATSALVVSAARCGVKGVPHAFPGLSLICRCFYPS